MKSSVFEHFTITPFAQFGLTGSFWEVNLDTMIQTWIMLALLIIFTVWCRRVISRPYNLAAQGLESFASFFMNLVEESCGSFREDLFLFATSLFFFAFFCGVASLIPYVGEATQDLNTTFALGISSFCYSQYIGVKTHGIWGHFKEYLQPFFLLLPLNIVGELAKAASMSFRLFGNIVGGSIIFDLILHAMETIQVYVVYTAGLVLVLYLLLRIFPRSAALINAHRFPLYSTLLTALLIVPSIQLFFSLVEGMIQALVITFLTITYASLAVGDTSHEVQPESAS